jgi:hypothetical protein
MTQTNLKQTSRWLIMLGCALTLNLASADFPPAEELAGNVGIPSSELANLDKGKVISWKYAENTDKELADGIAIYLPVPLAKVIDYVKKGDFAGLDSTVTSKGNISDNAGVGAFKPFALTGDEAQDLLNVESGDKFNLSTAEIASFADLKNSLQGADDKAVAQAVSKRYREILAQRYQAYRQNGLSGIATYDRGGEQADPASELRTAAERGSPMLVNHFPDLYQAWVNYPQALPDGVTETFFWQNSKVEDRPTAILAHRLVQSTDNSALVLRRQFYVGHSYNSSQFVAGCLPYKDGALVFYALRSSTDQVAGIGSGMKHSIGRDRMKAEMVKQLQRLRTSLI